MRLVHRIALVLTKQPPRRRSPLKKSIILHLLEQVQFVMCYTRVLPEELQFFCRCARVQAWALIWTGSQGLLTGGV